MATIVTGRTRTIKFSGDIVGEVAASATVIGGRRTVMNYQKSDAITINGFKPDAFSVGPTIWTANTLTVPAPLSGIDNGLYEVQLFCDNGCGGTDSDTTGSTAWAGSFSYPLTGTYSIELDVEELLEIDDTSTDWPSYGGAAQTDGPFYTTARFYERLRIGGNAVVTATVGTLSVSASSVIDGTDQLAFGTINYQWEGLPQAIAANIAETCSLTCKFQDTETLSAPYTYSTPDGSVSATGGSSATVNSSGFGYTLWGTESQASIKPLLQYRLMARARSFEDAYDGNPTYYWEFVDTGLTVTVSGNDITQDIELEDWACGGLINNVTAVAQSHLEWDRTRCYMAPTWLDGSGEDDRDWRCLWQGKPYAAFSLVHASTQTVEDGSSAADWSNTANTTLSSVAGAIRVVVSGGAGSCSMGSISPADWEAYRYLRIVIRSVGTANEPFTLGLGGKTWSGTTDTSGTYKTIDLDLCCPHNTAATTDTQDSRFPLAGYGGLPTTEGELWGVNGPTAIALTGLTNGATYEIDSITLRRDGSAHASFLPTFGNWLDWYSSYDVKLNIYSETDGRSGLEIPYLTRDTGPVYTQWTIADAITEINLIPGWTATVAGSFPDTSHDSGANAYWIGAEGSIRRAGAWTDQIDLSFNSSTDVYAQALFDVVQGYPHIYDAWESATYSGTYKGLECRFSKFLRGRAWGLGFNTSDEPFAAAKVIAYRAGPVSAGQGICDARGYYQTGSVYGKGDVSHTTEFQAGTAPYLNTSGTWLNRHRKRSSFRSGVGNIPGDGNVSYDVSDHSRHTVAYIGDANELYLATSPNTNPLQFAPATDETTPIVCDWCCIRYAKNHDNTLYLWTEESGTIYSRTSTDEGRGFSVSTSIATGSKPCAVITRDNLVMVYWIDGTAIKGRIEDSAGNILEATFTAVASGVDDVGIACDERVLGGGTRQIVLWYVASGTLTAVYATNGKTFS